MVYPSEIDKSSVCLSCLLEVSISTSFGPIVELPWSFSFQNVNNIVDTSPIDVIIDLSHANTNISNKDEISSDLSKAFVEVRNHLHDLVIGDISQGV